MSLTHIATASIPIVSWRSIINASMSFVPTPSVPETNTGSFKFNTDKSNIPPNPPKPPITPGLIVFCTCFFILETASYPASIFTPACSYAFAIPILQLNMIKNATILPTSPHYVTRLALNSLVVRFTFLQVLQFFQFLLLTYEYPDRFQ